MRVTPVYFYLIALLLSSCGDEHVVHQEDVRLPDMSRMVLIPAGKFEMGSPLGESSAEQSTQHTVWLDAYYLDRFEVTNGEFEKFVNETGYVTDAERRRSGTVWNPEEGSYLRLRNTSGVSWRKPHTWVEDRPYYPDEWNTPQTPDQPVLQVSWNDARAYCEWAGKRLPTEAEWEKAAMGTTWRRWPWGNEWVDGNAHITGGNVVPVDSFPGGQSPYDIFHLVGNVQEWVSDWYALDGELLNSTKNPHGPETGEFKVLKGGSWRSQSPNLTRCTVRAYQRPDYSSNFVGFRCAVDVKER